jgi:hypothetical protein
MLTQDQIDAIPGQPDGIEDDSRDMPDPARAAERILAYVEACGDGLYDVTAVTNSPLYGRDLCSVAQAVKKLLAERDELAHQAREWRMDAERLRLQLAQPDADHRAMDARATELERELTFRRVSEVNRARCERWHPNFPDDGWTGSDWSNAMAGEAGETCNVVKKLRRDDFGKVQAAADKRGDLLGKLATEIGDTFMYLDLLAQFYGLDLAQCVVETFNRVSVREGFPERLPAVDQSVSSSVTPEGDLRAMDARATELEAEVNNDNA